MNRLTLGVAACLLLGIGNPAPAQSTITATLVTAANGSVLVNPPTSQAVKIFVLFPPSPNVMPDYPNFRNNVANQSAIDGFNVLIKWSDIEPDAPSASGVCTTVNTDTCVRDSVGQYHTYKWTTNVDNRTSDRAIWPWFDSFGGQAKTVNIIFEGMAPANNGIQNSTPSYVTNPSYVGLFSTAKQDVLNNIEFGCSSYTGHSGLTITQSAGSSTATVTLNGNGYAVYDNIWVGGTGTSLDTPSTGAAVATTATNTFTYPTAFSPTTITVHNANVINAFESWILPYESPYLTAYRAALTALFLHFKPGYMATDDHSNSRDVSSQLGYIRFGQSVGGEAFVYCTSTLSDPAKILPPYTYVATTGTSGTSVGWLNDYYLKNIQWAMGQFPYMKIYGALNEVDKDTTYPDTEAQFNAQNTNGGGFFNGFGSQGLSLADHNIVPCVSGSTASNWCYNFQQWYMFNSPLELQQISLSDPKDTDCVSGPKGPCAPPPADSGDLRVWLPFAVNNHVNVIELYYRDAALAFDPIYCASFDPTTGVCIGGYSFGSNTFLNQGLQAEFMNEVGQGSGCGVSGAGGASTGDCSYASCITAAHGLHSGTMSCP